MAGGCCSPCPCLSEMMEEYEGRGRHIQCAVIAVSVASDLLRVIREDKARLGLDQRCCGLLLLALLHVDSCLRAKRIGGQHPSIVRYLAMRRAVAPCGLRSQQDSGHLKQPAQAIIRRPLSLGRPSPQPECLSLAHLT